MIFNIDIKCVPVPWSAPRRARNGGMFSPPRYAAYKKDVVLTLRSLWQGRPTVAQPVRLDIVVRASRGDRTNHQKAIEDCLELAGIIKNDSFVLVGETELVRTKVNPGFSINMTFIDKKNP